MKHNKLAQLEYENIIQNLKWALNEAPASFNTMMANSLRTRNNKFIDSIKKATGKKEIYIGADWAAVCDTFKSYLKKNN